MNNRIKVAIVGLGNCASALIQGIYLYRQNSDLEQGLISPMIGSYSVGDIDVVAAFDVDAQKVGKDISEAIGLGKNNVRHFCDVPKTEIIVSPAPILDGLSEKYKKQVIEIKAGDKNGVLNKLAKSEAEIIVNYLPVGSKEATRWWADITIDARCAFINCIPEFIASDSEIAEKFSQAGIPLFGDDIKSQFGATLLHRIIVQHMEMKGITIDNMYQLNFGGNMDFYNMLNKDRLSSKRISKQEAVRSLQKSPIEQKNVHIGPSDHIEWLEDQKWCYIHIQGRGFGGTPMRLEAKLEVCDSPNSAGVVVDVIRLAKIALDRDIYGPVNDVCAFYMKSPPEIMNEDLAFVRRNEWIRKHSIVPFSNP